MGSFALAGCLHRPSVICQVEPALFCAPFEQLATELPDKEKRKLLALPADQLGSTHFNLGMAVRNRFGLWQDNELSRFFRDSGATHADEMSTPFIEGFARYLRGQPADMKAILSSRLPPPPLEPDPEFAR